MRFSRRDAPHGSLRALVATAVVATTTLVVAAPTTVEAAVIRPFTIRYQNDINGAIDMFGNTLMTCQASVAACSAAQNPPAGSTANATNNNFSMIMVDADGAAFSTVNSSSSDVAYPATATVRFAGLYWGAQSASAARTQMKLRGPGDASYTTIASSRLDASGSAYQGFADVTSFVRTHGVGTYWGADVAATTGTNQYGGWSLVVVWEDSSQPLRNLTVFDGYGIVQNTAADRTISIPLSGFLTPPFGPVQTEIGVIAYEGDRGAGATGDGFRLNTTDLGNALNPTNDAFNGTISNAGVNESTRNPSYINSLGYDVDEFNAAGILPNSTTTATVTLTTGGETFYPGVIHTAIDLYAPSFPTQTKTVTNLTRGVDPALPGDVLEYNLSIINTGLDPANNTVVTDILPLGVTFVPGSLEILTGANAGSKTDDADNDQAGYAASARTITFRLGSGATGAVGGTLVPNASTTMRFRVTVDLAAAGSTITNQFALNYVAQTINRPFTYNSNPVSTPVTPLADLRISKTASPSPIVAGDPGSYTVTVTNNGPSPARDVVISDALPAGVTLVSATPSAGSCSGTTCTIGTVPFPGAATVTYLVTSASNLAAGSLVANTATVTTSTGDPAPGNETTTITTPVVGAADLAATKTVSPSTAVAGQNVTWTVTVTNNGPSDALALALSDALPAGLSFVSATPSVGSCVPTGSAVDCALGTLADGASVTISIVTKIEASVLGAVANTARASSTTPDPNAGNNSGTAAVDTVGRADLSIAKTATISPVVPGLPATWQIAVTNNGPSDAAGVVVSDTAPGGVSWTSASSTVGTCAPLATLVCSIGTLAAGATATITVTGATASTLADGSTLTNTASVTSTTIDPTPGTTSSTTVTPVDAQVELVAVKTANPDPVVSGQPLTYTLQATNNGPSTATNVVIADAAPAGVTFTDQTPSSGGSCSASAALVECTFASLPPGSTASVTITAAVDTAFVGTAITNVATFDSDQTDPRDATFVNSVGQRADTYVAKTALTAAVTAGTVAQWQIQFGNNGPSDAQGVTLLDSMPTGMTITAIAGGTCTGVGTSTLECAVDTLVPGSSVTVTVSVAVDAAVAAGPLANTAQVSAATPEDPTSSNNAAMATMEVTRSADVSVSKTASGPIVPGAPSAFTVTATNNGPSTATAVTVTDTLSSGLTFDPATSDPRCSAAGQLVTCVVGTLGIAGPGSTTALQIGVTSSPSLTAAVANTATVSSSTPDPDPTDNGSTVTVPVAPSADLALAKVGPTSVTAGLPAVWTVTVTNTGPSNAAGFTVADTPPSGITWTAITSDSAGVVCTLATGVCTFGSLPAEATATLTFVGQVAAGAIGSIVNAAAITAAATPDPVSVNDVDSVDSPIVVRADLNVTKQSLDSPAIAGTQAGWTITVTNNGPSAATAVELVDTVSAGLTLQSLTPSAGSCSLVTASCALGTIGAGATVTVNVVTLVAADQSGQTLANTAVASSPTDPDPDPPVIVELPVVGEADLSISKSASTATVVAGGTMQWTITVVNNGSSVANAATISDSIPAGLSAVTALSTSGTCNVGAIVECAFGDLTPGQTVFVVVRGTLSSSVAEGSSVTNTVTGSSATTDPDLTDNTAATTTPVIARSDLRITKTATSSPFVPGRTVSWTITIVNDGPSDARAVSMTDAVPTGVTGVSFTPSGCTGSTTRTCNRPTLAAGASFSWTMTGTLSPAFAGATLDNTARVSAATIDPAASNNVSTASTPVVPSADLAVTKTVDGTPIAGGPISWTIRVVNNGPSVASDVQLSDVIPAAVIGVSVSPAAGCTIGATVTCSYPTLAVGSPIVLTLSGTLAAGTDPAAVVANTARVASGTNDPITGNDASTATTSIATSADVSITKVASGPLAAGQSATWTIEVRNGGPSTARAVTVSDTLPADLLDPTLTFGAGPTTCSVAGVLAVCDVGDLDAGASVTITVTGTISPGHTGPITNSASVRATTPDPAAGNNSVSTTDPVAVSADLSIVKRATPSPFVAGQPVTYSLEVRNAGPATAADVSVEDLVPSGMTFESVSTTLGGCTAAVACILGDLPPGAVVTITIHARPDSGFAHATDVTNTASVASTTPDPDVGDRTSSTTNEVRRVADLVATKLATPITGDTWEAGENGRYTLTVTNLGPSWSGDVTLTDVLAGVLAFDSFVSVDVGLSCPTPLGATITCTASDIPAGTSLSVVVEVVLDPGATPGNVVNTLELSQIGADDPRPLDNTASTTIAANAEADVQIEKSTTATSVDAGSEVAWELVVTNLGPSNAATVTVSDTLPVGLTWVTPVPAVCVVDVGDPATVECTLGTVAPGVGGAVTLVLTAAVEPAHAAGQVLNAATVASATPDPTSSNNTSSAAVEVVRAADLAITKLASAAATTAGTEVSWSLSVVNNGLSTATDTVVTDLLPDGLTFVSAPGCTHAFGLVTCALGTLDPSDVVDIVVTTLVDPGVTAASITNVAQVTSTTSDRFPDDNTGSDTTTIGQIADLSITKTASPTALVAGEPVTYTITVDNGGPSDAVGVVVTDLAPAGVVFRAVTSTVGLCDLTASCDLGPVPSGASFTITIVGDVAATVAHGATITNSASVTSDTPDDPAGAPNSAEVVNDVARVADLVLTKSFAALAPPNWDAGELGRYTLTVINLGPSASGVIDVFDALPAEVSFVSFVGTPPCLHAVGDVSCAASDLAPGVPLVMSFDVVLLATTLPTDLTNSATVTQSAATDPDPSNDSGLITTPTSASADLVVTKQAGAAEAHAGTTAAWTITVANAGTSDATEVVVTDTLPTGLIWAAVPPTCSIGPDDTITCALGTIPAGAEVVLAVTAAIDPAHPGGPIVNSAAASSATPDPDPVNSVGAGPLTILRSADVSVVKSAAAPTVLAGTTTSFTFDISNAGPSTAEQTVVTDTLPAGMSFVVALSDARCQAIGQTVTCDLGTLTPGSPTSATVVVAVDADADAATLTNAADVGSLTPDAEAANNVSEVDIEVVRAAGLRLTKGADGAFVAGATASWTITVSNVGPSTARDVQVVDQLPLSFVGTTVTVSAGSCAIASATLTCDLGTVAPGAIVTIVVTGSIDPGASGSLTNTAAASSSTPNPAPDLATDSASAELVVGTDLSIAKAGPSTLVAGGSATWTIVVTNGGPATARAVSVADPAPSGVAFTIAATDVGSCSVSASAVDCQLGDLAPGQVATITVTGTLASDLRGTIANVASVASPTADTDPADNAAAARAELVATSDLTIAKSTTNAPVRVGQNVEWRLDVVNRGPSLATEVVVSDPLPAGLSVVALPAECSAVGALVTCRRAQMAVGETWSVVLVTRSEVAGSIANTASVASSSGDPTPAASTAAVQVERLTVPATGGGASLAPAALALLALGLTLVLAGRRRRTE